MDGHSAAKTKELKTTTFHSEILQPNELFVIKPDSLFVDHVSVSLLFHRFVVKLLFCGAGIFSERSPPRAFCPDIFHVIYLLPYFMIYSTINTSICKARYSQNVNIVILVLVLLTKGSYSGHQKVFQYNLLLI